jgi:hypothetical protein
MLRAFRKPTIVLAAMGAMIVAASCGGGTEPTEPSADDVRDFITAVATSNGQVSASFRSGSPPAAGSGPVATVTGSSAMILGGGALRTVSSGTAFTRIIVAIDGIDGYWELTLSGAVTIQEIILTLAQEVPQQVFSVEYAAGTAAAIGAFDTEPVSIITVGTGDVQVSVSWDVESDVDLHVVEPGGAEIYYGNETSASGGTLDLDSNAGCSIDGKKNENITWPSSTPPRGTYTVRVDYWDSCGMASTRYVVTVHVKGQSPRTFTGTFTGPGDNGGAGDGVTIVTFTF